MNSACYSTTARAEPVTIEKHGRPVVVVLAVEEFGRLTAGQTAGGEATKMVSQPVGLIGQRRGSYE